MTKVRVALRVESERPTVDGRQPRPVHAGRQLGRPGRASRRISYLDRLRTVAVLGVVVYHALLPFADDTWFIRNAERSEPLMAIVVVFQTFGLAILFLVAGASARFALETRSNRAFLRERAARLLVPFVVGAVALGPLVWYLSGLHNGTWSGSFLGFLPAYPGIVYDYALRNVGPSPALFATVGMHLWFLAWLFAYAALGLPVFSFLASARGRSFVNALARLMRRRGTTLLFALPVGLPVLLLFAHARPGLWDWWAFGWYGVTFVIGYVIYSDARLVAAARRDFLPALIVAVLGSAALVATGFTGWVAAPHGYDATYVVMIGLFSITSWAWTLALLGVGMHAAFMQRPLRRHVGEAVLPTYVLHLPIVVAVSFLVVQWRLGLGAKILINVGLGVGATLLVVAATMRVPILRPLMGLRHSSSEAPRGIRASPSHPRSPARRDRGAPLPQARHAGEGHDGDGGGPDERAIARGEGLMDGPKGGGAAECGPCESLRAEGGF